MSLNTLGNKLYLTGLKGSSVLRVGKGRLDQISGVNPNLKSTMVENYANGDNMILQEPNSNDYKFCGSDLSEIKRMQGNFKEGTGNNIYIYIFEKIRDSLYFLNYS